MPTTTRIFERLASFSRVVLWDKRGTGLSDPIDHVPTLDERTDDVMALMNTVGSERAAFFGVSEGGPMSLLFAATHPERTAALILYGASPKFSAAPDWAWGWSEDDISEFVDDIHKNWGDPALINLFAPSQADKEALQYAWGRYQRMGASPSMARAVLEALCQLDCREILSAISAPTLEYPSEDHLMLMYDPDPIIDEIEQFLTGVRHDTQPNRILTVMFTDISRAITCACAVRDAVRQFGIDVRIGLHTGECELMGDHFGGVAVHTGARVSTLAEAGEILVSSTVKDLVAGSRIDFAERGTHHLKGVPGEWRLFAVTA
jgi:pimeloyl-ACP methyl ester carboxylesterase